VQPENNGQRPIGDATVNAQSLSYLLFGLTLVVLFIVIVAYYYTKKRHRSIEEAKYRMLDDDE
jgi:cbb3-type cytochrome oxidase subunit 3